MAHSLQSVSQNHAGKLVAMAWPMIVTQASLALMQLADVWMVSHLGNHALAAIAPATLMVLAVATFGFGYLTSVNTLVGQNFGAGDRRRCVHVTWQGIWSACLIGFLTLAFVPAAPDLFALFAHEPRVRALEVRYFEISMMAVLPQLLAVAIGNYFLATGQPKIAMVGTLIAVLSNLVLNYVLIFGTPIIPALGFAGAAWGTLLASTFHGMLMLTFFLFHRGARRLEAHRPKVSRRDLRQLAKVGIYAGIQDSVELVAWGVVLVYLVGQFGEIHLAAASVLIRCMQLSFLPADGLGSALTALVANAIGARRQDHAQELTRLGFLITATYMVSIAVAVYIFRYPIMRLFSQDPNVIAIGAQAMVCVSLFQVFDAMNVTFSNALQGAGDSAWPSLTNLILSAVILLGGGSLMIHFAPTLGSFGIWSMAALYIAAQGLSLAMRWLYGPWRLIDFRNDPEITFETPGASLSDLAAIEEAYAKETRLRSNSTVSRAGANSKKGD
jgi:MATE family multidrug resistance protein